MTERQFLEEIRKKLVRQRFSIEDQIEIVRKIEDRLSMLPEEREEKI